MRISDWSSDVCSSDLSRKAGARASQPVASRLPLAGSCRVANAPSHCVCSASAAARLSVALCRIESCACGQYWIRRGRTPWRERECGGEGKGVLVRGRVGGWRTIEKKKAKGKQK